MTIAHEQPNGSIRLEIEVHRMTDSELPFKDGDITKMMDTLRDNKPFKLKAVVSNFKEDNPDELHVFFGKKSVMFWDGDGNEFAVKTSDVSVIRNLAGALILWANYQDKLNPSGEETFAAFRLFGWHRTPNDSEAINGTRTKWYARTVGMMTPQTLQRNFEDLTAIENEMASKTKVDTEELRDIRVARNILWSEMCKRETPSQEKK